MLHVTMHHYFTVLFKEILWKQTTVVWIENLKQLIYCKLVCQDYGTNSLSIGFDQVNRPDPGQDIRPNKVAEVLEETKGHPETGDEAEQGDKSHGPWARPAPFQELLHGAWVGLERWLAFSSHWDSTAAKVRKGTMCTLYILFGNKTDFWQHKFADFVIKIFYYWDMLP